MEPKWTKGPWAFRLYMQTEEEVAFLKQHGREPTMALDNEGSATVLSLDGPVARAVLQREVKRADRWKAEDEERDANAQLIAAAPELYKALKNMVSAAGDWQSRWIDEARDALAKAEGKS